MKREHQAQCAGDVFSTLADTLKHHLQPYAVLVGLLAAVERFIHYFVERATEANGPTGRRAAIHAARAGLTSLQHTVSALEGDAAATDPPATLVVGQVKSPHSH